MRLSVGDATLFPNSGSGLGPDVNVDATSFQVQFYHPRFWHTWLHFSLIRLISFLPDSWILALGRKIGHLNMRLAPQLRRTVATNLALCLPHLGEQEREALLIAHFEAFGTAVFEAGAAWWWPKARLRRRVEVTGLEHLERHDKQGVLLVAPHGTSMKVAVCALQLYTDLILFYGPHHKPVAEYLSSRGSLGRNPRTQLIPGNTPYSLLEATKILRAGHILFYSPDRDFGPTSSVFVPWFGISAATTTGTSTLAQASKAAVVPLTYARLPGSLSYQLTIHPELKGLPSGDHYADAKRLNAFFETHIMQWPEQYKWTHKRFATRPTGESSFYACDLKPLKSG